MLCKFYSYLVVLALNMKLCPLCVLQMPAFILWLAFSLSVMSFNEQNFLILMESRSVYFPHDHTSFKVSKDLEDKIDRRMST